MEKKVSHELCSMYIFQNDAKFLTQPHSVLRLYTITI